MWGRCALLACAALLAPPALAQATPPEPLLDCSLHRYGEGLGAAVAATLDAFAQRVPAVAELQAAAKTGQRTDVTPVLHRERLIYRVADCSQPVVRGYVNGARVELEIAALQQAVCTALVSSPHFSGQTASATPRHAPSGQARCGVARNLIPGLLVLGPLTQAGRMLPGENTVTVLQKAAAPPPAAQCPQPEVPVTGGATPAYLAHLRTLPASNTCRLDRGARWLRANEACQSLHDKTVYCHGDPEPACRSALEEVRSAVVEWSKLGVGARLSTAARADWLARLMTVNSIDKLDGIIALPGARLSDLHHDQTEALETLLDDGARNVDDDFERSQEARYQQVEAALIDKWLPRVRRAGPAGMTAAEVWANNASQREPLIREAFELVAAELGLGKKRLFLVEDCTRDLENMPRPMDPLAAGAYAPPAHVGRFAKRYGPGDVSMADSVYLCANRIAEFKDLRLTLETVLEEVMHAGQVEMVMQGLVNRRAASPAACTQARILIAGWGSFSQECRLDAAELARQLFSLLDTTTWERYCWHRNHFAYANRPHEFHAKKFAKRVADALLAQALR